jgi:hypothetical protein
MKSRKISMLGVFSRKSMAAEHYSTFGAQGIRITSRIISEVTFRLTEHQDNVSTVR